MTDENRKFINIVLVVYLSALSIAAGFSVLIGILENDPIVTVMGNVMLYGGVFLFILGFTIMGSSRGLLRRETPEQHEARRKREQPVELVATAIITGGLLVSISGYLVLYFVIPSV